MFQSKTSGGNSDNKNIKLLSVVTILLFAGVLRFSLLSTTYQYPSGEEAIYGLIAKELIEDGKITIKPYNVSYGGGTYVESFLSALSFKVFGISNISLKIPILLLSLVSLGLVLFLGFRFLGPRYGIVWGIIYGFCPAFAKWNFTPRGGYIGLLVFIPLLIIFFLQIYKESGYKNIILFGFLSAFAFWNQPLILSFLITFSLFFFITNLNHITTALTKSILYIFISLFPRIFIEFFRESSLLLGSFVS